MMAFSHMNRFPDNIHLYLVLSCCVRKKCFFLDVNVENYDASSAFSQSFKVFKCSASTFFMKCRQTKQERREQKLMLLLLSYMKERPGFRA